MRTIHEEKKLLGLPLIEAYVDDKKPKKLCFINHGFTSNKSEGTYFMMFELARLGYHVVAIDAHLHGDRYLETRDQDMPYPQEKDLFTCVMQTAKDIKKLYDTYYSVQYDTCTLVGISMGAAVTMVAGAIIPEAKTLVSLIGFPSLLAFAKDLYAQSPKSRNQLPCQYDEIESMDPMSNLKAFAHKNILMINNTEDTIVPITYAQTFYDALIENTTARVTLEELPGGHEVPPSMRSLVYAYLK